MVLMAFTKTFKNKSLIQTITIVFSMFFGFGVSMIMNSINPTDQNEVLALLLKAGSLVQTFYKIFPTIILGVTTLTDLNVLPLLLLIISSAAIYVLVVIFARPLYFKGVIGSMYSGIKSNKKVKTNDFKKANIGVSYVLKEFRCLIRKPIFFTQCVLPYFLIPVLIIVSTIVGFNGSDSGLKFNQIGFVLNQVPGVERYVFIVAELILMFLFVKKPEDYLTFKVLRHPLLLRIFCETYKILPFEKRKDLDILLLYRLYFYNRNANVSRLVNEDPQKNVTSKLIYSLIKICRRLLISIDKYE